MSTIAAWPGRAEAWLDDRGKGAWIVAMVLGFIAFWPIGLFILGYMIFDDFPNAMTFAGIAIIVASGLYVIHRERLAAKAKAREPRITLLPEEP